MARKTAPVIDLVIKTTRKSSEFGKLPFTPPPISEEKAYLSQPIPARLLDTAFFGIPKKPDVAIPCRENRIEPGSGGVSDLFHINIYLSGEWPISIKKAPEKQGRQSLSKH